MLTFHTAFGSSTHTLSTINQPTTSQPSAEKKRFELLKLSHQIENLRKQLLQTKQNRENLWHTLKNSELSIQYIRSQIQQIKSHTWEERKKISALDKINQNYNYKLNTSRQILQKSLNNIYQLNHFNRSKLLFSICSYKALI